MKLTKKLESEILKAYNAYWDASLRGDMKAFASILDDNSMVFGSAVSEAFNNKAEAVRFYKATADQMAGKAQFRNRKIGVHPVDQTVLIHEQSDLFVLIDREWTFYGPARISALFVHTPKGWKLAHVHCSLPDNRAEEGEQIAAEKIKEENLALREAVQRRTVELEQKNRELEIEAALERVRAVAMGMKKPDDILDVCRIMFKELKSLGFQDLRNALINFWDDAEGSLLDYDYSDYAGGHIAKLPYNRHPTFEEFQKKIRVATDAFAELVVHKRQLKTWRQVRRSSGEYEDARLARISALYYYFYSIGVGAIGISTFSSLSSEKLEVLKRFRNVFDLAHRRYADIQQAEGQAREAQIEAALERIRASAMAMHTSDELENVVHILREQMGLLGQPELETSVIHIYEEGSNQISASFAYRRSGQSSGTITSGTCFLPKDSSKVAREMMSMYDAGKSEFTIDASGAKLTEFLRVLMTAEPRIARRLGPSAKHLKRMYNHFTTFRGGALVTVTYQPPTEEVKSLQRRAAVVFDMAYRRYLDLQKAEAQAREAQIETALERVRSRSMAMHKSEELSETSFILFKQLKDLGEVAEQMSIGVYDEQEQVLELYSTIYGNQWKESGRIPYDKHVVHRETHAAWKKKRKSIVIDLSGKKLDDFNKFKMETSSQYKSEEELPRGRWVMHTAFFSKGMLTFSTHEPRPPETLHLLERFAAVFDLTYTRFLDLKKAEAQAREAQIEAALEKVRGRAMAMHTSSDLSATVSAVFSELRKLGVETIRTGVALYSQERPAPVFYASTTTEEDDALTITGSPNPSSHRCLAMQYEAWLKQQNYFPVLKGLELESYYHVLSLQPFSQKNGGNPFQHDEFGYYLPFSEGNFYAWSLKPFTEDDVTILARFKAIVDLTFRRYFDLQKAEAQAREAQIEASLERVRSRTLAMQRSDELADTASVLFKQLITLGIEPNRLYIAIMKDDVGNVEFWITDEDGSKVSSAFNANLLANRSWKKMFDGWNEKRKSLTIDMQGEELQEYFRHLNTLSVPFKGGLSQNRRVQTVAYFSRGFIGMASPDEQPEEATVLLERFAAVLNLTFTRFNDLKLAEAQAHQAQLDLIQLQAEKKRAEDALSELGATQAQLVQQEKLASLGQLTAGIAHEIKNPLNFVNNFSSVSVELVDEVIDEIKRMPDVATKGIPQLLSDVKTNLGKIIEHGSRADGIVKSMLQHSRGGSSRMEPTDLNALIKEYVNLAFHGMRASKNPFNIEIELDLDKSVGEVLLKAEDFSRVILNLCQNAFDAMRDKLQSETGKATAYRPKLTARTRRETNKIVVQIEDNGPGIPEAIMEKVLQPFFTTKKGTQGTGLGLSITNDIVKAHGGEMKIETNGNGGATFVIGLPAEIQK